MRQQWNFITLRQCAHPTRPHKGSWNVKSFLRTLLTRSSAFADNMSEYVRIFHGPNAVRRVRYLTSSPSHRVSFPRFHTRHSSDKSRKKTTKLLFLRLRMPFQQILPLRNCIMPAVRREIVRDRDPTPARLCRTLRRLHADLLGPQNAIKAALQILETCGLPSLFAPHNHAFFFRVNRPPRGYSCCYCPTQPSGLGAEEALFRNCDRQLRVPRGCSLPQEAR